MSIETTLVKRGALYKGEIGFFAGNPMAEEDIRPIALDRETMHTISEERKLESLKFLWGLVHKTADNTDIWLDKDVAMDDLKKRAGYTRTVYDNKTKQLKTVPKSLKRINETQLKILTERIMDIICAEVLPGMKKNTLRREVEEMLGVKR